MTTEERAAAEAAVKVLREWERWEADIILDGNCWPGPWPVITEPHYDALVTNGLQVRRTKAYEALEAVLAAQPNQGA